MGRAALDDLAAAVAAVGRGLDRPGRTDRRMVVQPLPVAPVEDWLPGGIPELDEVEARVRLAQAWLESFGPATLADLQWWTGWNLGQTRAAVAALDVRDVELEAGDGVMLGSTELAESPGLGAAAGHVALLPSLDPTAMGWKRRDWYLGPHREHLFDTAGNIGATVWWEGRIVGAWAVRSDGTPAVRLLEDIGADGAAAVDAEVVRICSLLEGAA
ncbi:crosslink repair DNA glycosylase YcaQ family protein [Oerskovia sp. M15]